MKIEISRADIFPANVENRPVLQQTDALDNYSENYFQNFNFRF